MFSRNAPGGKGFTIRVCGSIFLKGFICHHLPLTLIQVKLAVHFLLFYTKLTKAFFMLKGAVHLLPVISQCLFHACNVFFVIFGITVKPTERIVNAGDCSQSVLCIQVRLKGLCAAQIQTWLFIFTTETTAQNGKALVMTKMLQFPFPLVFP